MIAKRVDGSNVPSAWAYSPCVYKHASDSDQGTITGPSLADLTRYTNLKRS